jgi:hypothetical protein
VTLRPLLFPETRRHLPYARWWNIAARTVHLLATGTLLGGHVFGVPAPVLWPYLGVAVGTGAILILLELYPNGHWIHQGCALTLYAKLVVLSLIPFFWEYRVALLVAVVVLAGVGSHAPRTFRHYSVWYKRVMAD